MRHLTITVDRAPVTTALVADTYWTRLRGMLGRRPLPPAMLIRPANSVHGMGMRDPLDVAVLDRDGTVLATHVLRPFGFTRPAQGGVQVLEAPVGSFDRWSLTVGSRVGTTAP